MACERFGFLASVTTQVVSRSCSEIEIETFGGGFQFANSLCDPRALRRKPGRRQPAWRERTTPTRHQKEDQTENIKE